MKILVSLSSSQSRQDAIVLNHPGAKQILLSGGGYVSIDAQDGSTFYVNGRRGVSVRTLDSGEVEVRLYDGGKCATGKARSLEAALDAASKARFIKYK